jgi:hypothetical protein
MSLDLKSGAIKGNERGGGVSYSPTPSNPVCILGLLKNFSMVEKGFFEQILGYIAPSQRPIGLSSL